MASKTINLALQGGGAHGAFTWGVLDRLLEEERLEIEAISGTSAGAVNAVILAEGLRTGGRDGARGALEKLWKTISNYGDFSPVQRHPVDMLTENWSLDASPALLLYDLMSRVISPYMLNPLNINPLREILNRLIDWPALCDDPPLKLFISATNVRTGRVKVFDMRELTCDKVLASASLPLLFQASEIDGEAYWDGGYLGNPALFPFHYACKSRDIVIVQINPLERDEVPTNARDIVNRLNEVTFNASLMHELRAINFVARLLDTGQLDSKRYRKMFVHFINSDKVKEFGAASKYNAEWAFFEMLKATGREAADNWLDDCWDQIGEESSIDLRALFD